MSELSNLSILCVEDEAFALNEMMYYLKKKTGHVHGAKDGEEGLEMAGLHNPNVIVADLLMPKLDGLSMIRKLRSKGNDAHIIIVTSVDSVDTVLEAANLGIDGYIVKPLDFVELEVKLSKISDNIRIKEGKISGVTDVLKNRGAIEEKIKKAYIKMIKEFTGKGPREAVVQIMGDEVKITAFDALTIMENNLICQKKNIEPVKMMRMQAYESMSETLAEAVSKETGLPVRLSRLDINIKKQLEKVEFIIQS